MVEQLQNVQQGLGQALPTPKEEKNFLENWGLLIATGALFLFLISGCDLKTGRIIDTGMACWDAPKTIYVIAFVLIWVVFIRFAKNYLGEKQKIKGIVIKPFDPVKEIPALRNKILTSFGYRVNILRWNTEPEFGRIAAEDNYFIHFHCEWQDAFGVLRPLMFKINMKDRAILGFEPNHSHIETPTHSWSNAKKGQEPFLSPFMRKPTYVSYEQAPPLIKEEKKENEESEEEE